MGLTVCRASSSSPPTLSVIAARLLCSQRVSPRPLPYRVCSYNFVVMT